MSQTQPRYEKSPLQSKKFIAFLVAECTWKAVVMLMIALYGNQIPFTVTLTLLSICIITGFLEVGYIIGQASLDKYVRVAEITGDIVGKPKGKSPRPSSKGDPE